MSDTRDALMRAILVDPADDTPRLVIADWLEENGEPERAEFVRVQVELATMQPCVSSGNWIKCVELPSECRYCCLRRREQELWSAVESQFAHPNWQTMTLNDRFGTVPEELVGTVGVVRRGFVSTVRCRLADWVGGECGFCDGRGHFQTSGSYSECPRCLGLNGKGTGRTAAHGPRIVAEQPVTEVRTDAEPFSSSGTFTWFFNSDKPRHRSEEPSYLPEFVFALLEGEPVPYHRVFAHKDYPTEAAAQSALSLALVQWARREAGLPPLEERR